MLPKGLPRIGRFQIRRAPSRSLFGPRSNGVGFKNFDSAAQNNNTNVFQQQQQVVGVPLFGAAPPSNSIPGFGSGGLFDQSNPAASNLFGRSASSVGAFGASSASAQPIPTVLAQDTSVQPAPFGAAPAPEGPDEAGFDGFEEVLYEEGPSENNTQPTVVVQETPLSMNFSVSESANIPSDGLGHQVTLAVIPFQAAISHISIPRIDPRIYLQVRTMIVLLIMDFRRLMFNFSVMSRTPASISYYREP